MTRDEREQIAAEYNRKHGYSPSNIEYMTAETVYDPQEWEHTVLAPGDTPELIEARLSVLDRDGWVVQTACNGFLILIRPHRI